MKPQEQQLLASLVSWSPSWSNRLLEERKEVEVATQGKFPSSPAQHLEDKKSGSKKVVTWDELVSSDTFLGSEFRCLSSGSRQEVPAIRGGICEENRISPGPSSNPASGSDQPATSRLEARTRRRRFSSISYWVGLTLLYISHV